MRLNQLGETKVIQIIKRIAYRRRSDVLVSIGDDACVLRDGTVITTDSYLDKVHFDLSYMSFQDIGKKVACATLSDIAAMAARPIGLFIALLVPPETRRKSLVSLYQGIDEICRMFSVEIAGGDIVASEKLAMTLTALGKTKRPILRSTAQPGDYLYITGKLGLAETGRLILKLGMRDAECGIGVLSKKNFLIPTSEIKKAVQRHIAPIPRIFEAQKIVRYATSMIDTSDGLSTDAFHLAAESKVKIKIFADSLPISNITTYIVKSAKGGLRLPLSDFVYNAGEDYELLFTTRKELPFNRILGTEITRIGIVEKGSGVWIIEKGKTKRLSPKGYDHLR
uniref:Thiamine-monophosphate kinase n=1 Tax=candidate division WOR-3 bacterium TaxID=2052148 RepID=A0A7C6A9E7_UNCW3